MPKKAKRGINIPQATQITYSLNTIKTTNNRHTEQTTLKKAIYLIKIRNRIFITRDQSPSKALKGTYHSIINNIIHGINKRFKKTLIIEGIGFSAQKIHNLLEIKIGFTHPRYIPLNHHIKCQIIATKKIILKSTNNILLGNICKQIQALRKYNAYKNKGIREAHEIPIQKKRTKK
ncbi:hypothetical protein JSR02_00760 [Candidatus Vidania fulgoroideae]|uniref:50S ribosomal protein L6 n=1 Tax=Candidatus Vidania fulgoroideorum TaxID=881286 RepID=A0A974X764_9PROT|nr:hypothetical protein JSR02_00760 [Candidatus Vidania fulgoroideae]